MRIKLPGLDNTIFSVEDDDILYLLEKDSDAGRVTDIVFEGEISLTTTLSLDAVELLFAAEEATEVEEDSPDESSDNMANSVTPASEEFRTQALARLEKLAKEM